MKRIIIVFIGFINIGILSMELNEKEMSCKDGVCSIKDRKKESIINEQEKSIVKRETDVIQITSDNFDNIVKKATKPVIIDFYAIWCQPCNYIKPIFSELAKEEKEWIFASVDVDKEPKIMANCFVQAMPTFVIFKNGIQWGSVKGALPKEQLITEFKKIINMSIPAANSNAEKMQQLFMAITQLNLVEIKKLILIDKLDVNGIWETAYGSFSPLKMAIILGTEEIIDFLINSGAIIDKAIEESKEHVKFYENQLKINQQSLDYAKNKIKTFSSTSIKSITKVSEPELGQKFITAMNNEILLKNLINEGANVNTIFDIGKGEVTPICLAIMLSKTTAIDLLIEAGATLAIEITNEHGCKKTIEDKLNEDIENFIKQIKQTRQRIEYTSNKMKLNPRIIKSNL